MSLAVLEFELILRDITGLARPLLAASHPFRGSKNPLLPLTNIREKPLADCRLRWELTLRPHAALQPST
jgi:hypothetical protein